MFRQSLRYRIETTVTVLIVKGFLKNYPQKVIVQYDKRRNEVKRFYTQVFELSVPLPIKGDKVIYVYGVFCCLLVDLGLLSRPKC